MIDNRLPAAQRASVADTIHTRALARAAEAQGSTQSLAGLLHVPENTLLRMTSELACAGCGERVVHGNLISQLAKDAVHQSRAMTIARAKRQAPRAAKRAIKPSS